MTLARDTASPFSRSPFERLRSALDGIAPGAPPLDLSVGSPRHTPAPFIAEVIASHAASWGGYPPIAGTPNFQRAVHDWLDRRFALGGWFREAGGILPLSGSREGLFFAAIMACELAGKANPAILFANPFYQTYPAAARAVGAEPVPLRAADNVAPDWTSVPEASARPGGGVLCRLAVQPGREGRDARRVARPVRPGRAARFS